MQHPSLHRPPKNKRMKEVPIEIRYAKLPIWTDWYFYLFIFFYLKLLPFQVAHLNFIFQHNAAPFHPPAREEEKKMKIRTPTNIPSCPYGPIVNFLNGKYYVKILPKQVVYSFFFGLADFI